MVPHPFPKLIPDMPATRLTKIGVGAWAFVAVLPGALSAARGALEPPGADMAATLRELCSPEVAAYLGACPRPMLAYTLPALLVAPAVLVCAAVGLRDDPIRPARLALKLVLLWSAANAGALVLIAGLMMARGHDAALCWSWASALTLALIVSGWAPVGLATAVVAGVRRRAVVAGLIIAGAIGVWGVTAEDLTVPVAPGAIDRALLTGAAGVPWRPLAAAAMWLGGGVVLAIGLVSRRVERTGLRATDRKASRPRRRPRAGHATPSD